MFQTYSNPRGGMLRFELSTYPYRVLVRGADMCACESGAASATAQTDRPEGIAS
jgi:hypothetical protein